MAKQYLTHFVTWNAPTKPSNVAVTAKPQAVVSPKPRAAVLDLRGQSLANVRLVLEPLSAQGRRADPEVSVRCIAIVSPQDSDAFALELADRGIILIEDDSAEDQEAIAARVMAGLGFVREPGESDYRRAKPSRPLSKLQVVAEEDPAYSRNPSYHRPERVKRWLDRLAQPWDQEQDRDTET